MRRESERRRGIAGMFLLGRLAQLPYRKGRDRKSPQAPAWAPLDQDRAQPRGEASASRACLGLENGRFRGLPRGWATQGASANAGPTLQILSAASSLPLPHSRAPTSRAASHATLRPSPNCATCRTLVTPPPPRSFSALAFLVSSGTPRTQTPAAAARGGNGSGTRLGNSTGSKDLRDRLAACLCY